MTAPALTPDLHRSVDRSFARRRAFALGIPALILAYLVYAAIAFDLTGLAARARLDNAAVLLSDFWSYKTHVTRDNRSGGVTVAIEGEAKGTYARAAWPGWVTEAGGVTTVDFGRGNVVTYDAAGARYVVPGYGTIAVAPDGGKLALMAPEPYPDGLSVSANKVTATTPAGRFSYSRAKVETFRYQPGWEMFFFTLDSPFSGQSVGALIRLAVSGPRVDPAQSNVAAMLHAVWTNAVWHHSDVAWAMFETVLMAFLGTMGAALVAFPLGFLSASNLMPAMAVRFGFRRVFDFIRGVDALIWTIIRSRAFGPGPMTGALAILITETGTFDKLFSEALENIDEGQVEGIRSTGANGSCGRGSG